MSKCLKKPKQNKKKPIPEFNAIFPRLHLEPEPLLNCPDWAEKNIYLAREAGCADPGMIRLDKFPHARMVLEAFSNPLIEEITLKFSAQCAKTTIIHCMIGYVIDSDPDPVMVVLPKDGNEKTWRDIRFKLLIKTSPALAAHMTGFEDDLAGEIFQFDNTFVKFASAGSPSALAETACRFIFLDEKNKYPPFSGKEASPSKLAKERAETFYNRKFINASTPTTEDGPISDDFERSDGNELWCKCPLCGVFQILTFFKNEERATGQIKWPDGATADDVKEEQSAWYECGACGGCIGEAQKWPMIKTQVVAQRGATVDKRGVVRGGRFSRHFGLKVWRVHAPFRTFSDIAGEFLACKDKPASLMNFFNSWLCEEWKEQVEKVSSLAIFNRREGYGPEIPEGVLLLTAWFDTQDDRLEGEIVGWGMNGESWGIEYITVQGDPGHPKTWQILDEEILKRTYKNTKGVEMKIAAAGVDTQGHHFSDVCDFARHRLRRVNGPRIYPTQGASIPANKPLKRLVLEPTRKNKGRVPLYNVDTSSIKKMIFKQLGLSEHGPKYMHFPLSYDEQYFIGLAESESLKRSTNKRGYTIVEWVKDPRIRNEPLDCRVGNIAVLYCLNVSWGRLEKEMDQKIKELKSSSEKNNPITRNTSFVMANRQNGWMNSWKK